MTREEKDQQVILLVENLTPEEAHLLREAIDNILKKNDVEGEIIQVNEKQAETIISNVMDEIKRQTRKDV